MKNHRRTPARPDPLALAQTLLMHPSWVPWLRLTILTGLVVLSATLLSAALIGATLINVGMVLATSPASTTAWGTIIVTAATAAVAAVATRAFGRLRARRAARHAHPRITGGR